MNGAPRPRIGSGDQDGGMNSKLLDRVAVIATVVIFCAALVVLHREFSSVGPGEVVLRLAQLPASEIYGLTATSYLLLTGYDFLALRYVARRLRPRDVLFVSFTAFAFSNGIGLQLLSGGSTRYRLYSGFGLAPVEIGEIVAFCTFTYALGVITVGGLVAAFNSAGVAAVTRLPEPLVLAAGVGLLALSIGYLIVAAVWHKPIALGRYRLRPPSLGLAIAQVVLASVDAVLAGSVMYALMPAVFGFTFVSFLNVYIIAATASVLSLVPGGLGVFEAVVATMSAPTARAAELGAFLAYRMIYFIVPLALALLWLALHELGRGSRRKAR
jgi:uncharacterized membrane protein YbhN (UPF0104 family)